MCKIIITFGIRVKDLIDEIIVLINTYHKIF